MRSPSGYSNRDIVLEWFRRVFDPQTKSQADGRPGFLINDGFGPHESLEVLQFCHENNIVLCRLPSHTYNFSHVTLRCSDLSSRHIEKELKSCTEEVQTP